MFKKENSLHISFIKNKFLSKINKNEINFENSFNKKSNSSNKNFLSLINNLDKSNLKNISKLNSLKVNNTNSNNINCKKIDNNSLKKNLALQELIKNNWQQICGTLENLGKFSCIKNDIIYIEVTHNVYRTDFILEKAKIIKKINSLISSQSFENLLNENNKIDKIEVKEIKIIIK